MLRAITPLAVGWEGRLHLLSLCDLKLLSKMSYCFTLFPWRRLIMSGLDSNNNWKRNRKMCSFNFCLSSYSFWWEQLQITAGFTPELCLGLHGEQVGDFCLGFWGWLLWCYCIKTGENTGQQIFSSAPRSSSAPHIELDLGGQRGCDVSMIAKRTYRAGWGCVQKRPCWKAELRDKAERSEDWLEFQAMS